MGNLAKIQEVCGVGVSELRASYAALPKARINMIAAGRYGSGVSESALTLSGYFNDLGLYCNFQSIDAGEEFFKLSQKITDAMSFSTVEVSPKELERFRQMSQELDFDISAYDALYINDHPGLLAAELAPAKKIYRCHFDISAANPAVWEFFKPHIEACDEIIFTHPAFHKELSGKISYITPSIDPCSPKNTFVPREAAFKILNEIGISAGKPLITQIARFDKTKDHFGLIDAFRLVRQEQDCRLALAAALPREDIGAKEVYESLLAYSGGDKDINIILMDADAHKVAALQSASDIIVQKSIRESFALSVTEALWKAKPVVASDVGGIPLQIKHGRTGLLCTDSKSCARAILDILQNPALGVRLGRNGQEYVKEYFLISGELANHLPVLRQIL